MPDQQARAQLEARGMAEPDLAIALRYEPEGDDAPRVTAKGRGAIAAQIIAVARDHGVAVRQDRSLAQLLSSLEVDSPIPVAAFAAVAEILAHLYRVDQQLARRHGRAAQP
jgi:flagellar biosynthesis protein